MARRAKGYSTFKMKGSPMQRNFPSAFKTDPNKKETDPNKKESDRDEVVKYTYPAGSVEARGAGYNAKSPRDVFISKGTKRLIEAGAPSDIIEASKKRDIELAKKRGAKTKNLGNVKSAAAKLKKYTTAEKPKRVRPKRI
jgi:hypothetical protein